MDPRFISAMSQWFIYFLPSIVAWTRLRMGKAVPLSLGQIFVFNLLVAWTVVGWILLMANALGYNPIPWVVFKVLKFMPGGGGAAMNAPQAPGFPLPKARSVVNAAAAVM